MGILSSGQLTLSNFLARGNPWSDSLSLRDTANQIPLLGVDSDD